MAVNVPQKVYSDGNAGRLCVYRVYNLTAGDTFQMSGDFVKVISAYFIATAQVFSTAPPVSANTVLTPAGGLANDDGYLFVWGSGVQQ